MKLYDINAALEALLEQEDPETGELLCDMDALEALLLERDEKLEGLALYVKNQKAEAEAIKAEKQALEKRQKAAENKAERAKCFLQFILGGEKFQTPKVSVSYPRTEAVDQGEDFLPRALEHDSFLRDSEPEPDKKAIAEAIKAGEEVPGAEIVVRQSMTIK